MRHAQVTAIGLIAAVCALLAPLDNAVAAPRCRTQGTEARPIPGPVLQIRTPAGPFRYRSAGWERNCTGESGNTWVRRASGLTDETGRRVLIPARYEHVYPISDTTALVGSGGAEPYRLYRFGVGEVGPTPYYHAQMMIEGASATAIAWSSWHGNQIRTLFVFDGRSEPTATPRVSGLREMRGVSRNYTLNFTTDKGHPVSIILDPAMRPLSPVIGRTEVWTTFPVDFNFNGSTLHFPRDLVSQTMRFEHPLLPYDGLYIPVAPDGTPLPLPAGAVGVFPLKRSHEPHAILADETFGWAVVFPTREGFEIAPVHAPLALALQQAPSAKRYTGMRRFSEIVMLQDASGWRPMTSTLQPVRYMPAGAVYADAEEGFLTVRETWARETDRMIENRRQQQAALDEARRQEGEAMWTRVQSGAAPLCSANPGVLPPAGLNRYFQECDVDSNTRKVLAPRVSAEAMAMARKRADTASARLAEDRERQAEARFAAARPAGDPWARGLAASQAAADASFNTFMQRQNDVYQSNLAAWNSGAHNWRPAGP